MLHAGRVVVEIAPPAGVVPSEAPLPSTMPSPGTAQLLADVVAVPDPDSGAFGFPRLRVAVQTTDAARLAVFLALPDGTAAVLPFEAADDGGTFEIAIPQPGTRIVVLEFATADDAVAFAREFGRSGVPGPGFGAGEEAPAEAPGDVVTRGPLEVPPMAPVPEPPGAEAPELPVPAPAPSAPPPAAPAPTVPAQVQAEMKPIVAAGSSTTLLVRLSRGVIEASPDVVEDRADIPVIADRPVTVTVVPRGFRFPLGTLRTRSLRLPATGSAEARFKLLAVDRGPAEVSVIVRQDAELPLATLRLTVEVVGSDDHDQAGVARVATSVTAPDPVVAALPTIRLDEELVGGRSTLHAAVSAGGETHRFRVKVGDKARFVRNVDERIAGLRAELAELPSAERTEVSDRRLRRLGAALADQLLDRRARELLWTHRDELDGLVVQTTGEVDLPWELLLVHAPGTEGTADDRFLAEYGATRWVYDTPHPTSIRVRRSRARYLCPEYASPVLALTRTAGEGEVVHRRFGAIAVEPDAADGLTALMSGGFDLLHFAGHGRWTAGADRRQELLLGGYRDDDATPAGRYTDADARRDLPHRPASEVTTPIVVLNACDVGRLPSGDPGLGGFAEAFLRGGAGAFVGCGWSVGDEPASRFVDAFYDELADGSTISRAARAGRAAASAAGDASALAYAVYAHPDARVRVE